MANLQLLPIFDEFKKTIVPTDSDQTIPKLTPVVDTIAKLVEFASSEWDQLLKKDYTEASQQLKGIDGLIVLPVKVEVKVGTIDTDKASDRFQYQNVEDLLNHAADLLDRAVKEQVEWARLSERWFSALLAIKYLLTVDSQLSAQANKGELSLLEEVATEEKGFLDSALVKVASARTRFQDNNAYVIEPRRTTELKRRKWQAQLGSHKNNSDTIPVPDQDLRISSVADTGAAMALGNALGEVVDLLEGSRMALQKIAFDVEAMDREVQENVLKGRQAALGKEVEYQENEASARLARLKADQEQLVYQALATLIPGGTLNCRDQLAASEARFLFDYRGALERIAVARLGLTKIYGIGEETLGPFPQQNNAPETRFTETLLWCRKAIDTLIEFKNREQRFVYRVSVRELVPDISGGWQNVQETGIANFVLVPPEIFSDLPYLRLDGVYVSAQSTPGDSWSLRMTCPRSGILRRPGCEPELSNLDQHHVPDVIVGRTLDPSNRASEELLGQKVFHNIVPFGEWTIRVSGKGASGLPRAALENIVLDLVLVGRP